MDYTKIYQRFIDSRRHVECTGYFEKHHVLPVAIGGGNEAANLIDLSARDHYFAHCCLAKIHGGKMWSALYAVACMSKADRSSSYFLRGRMVAIARTNAAIVRSANMTRLWAAGEFVRKREYKPLSPAVRAKMSASHSGNPKSASSIAKRSATMAARRRIAFRHVATERVFHGNQAEFCRISDISQSLASCLMRGRILSAKGWVLDGTNQRAILGRDATVRRFVNNDGREFAGTAYEFRTKFALDGGVISNLINGKNRVKSFKGWRVAAET